MTSAPRRWFARTPPRLIAAEAAECGLACMAMIGCHYGHDVDLNTLRQRFSPSLSGLTLRSLMSIGGDLGFACRPIRIELDELRRVPLPAILHWDLSHYVVLVAVSGRRVTIHDPASGARRLSIEAFSRHFSGVVLEVEPGRHFEAMSDRAVIRLRSLWESSRGMPQAIAQIAVLAVMVQLFSFVVPFYIQLATDRAIAGRDTALLLVLALTFAAMALLRIAATAMRDLLVQVAGNTLSYQIVGNVVGHLLRLPLGYFEKRHLGDVLSRVNSTSAFQDALTRGLVSGLLDGLVAVTALAVMFLYSAAIALVVLASALVAIAATLAITPIVRQLSEEQLTASAAERTHIMESVRALGTIRLMGREADREARWRNLFATVVNRNTALARRRIVLAAIHDGSTSLSLIATVFLGAREVIGGGALSIGMLFAFLSYRQTFADRTAAILTQALELRMLRLHLDRVGDIVIAERETRSDAGGTPAIEVDGAIAFVDVSFRYGLNDPFVLRNFDLSVRPGEYVAVTGPSGCGKSTFVKLMLGLMPPTSGAVLLDGHRGSAGLFRAWRERVGVVAQNDQLLSGSIAENIAFFEDGFDLDDVQAAARAAQIHDDIMRMPMRYSSLVGDMGSILSGGQRQRILLARALYRRPRVLILDEGTANLDLETERIIGDVIADLPITRIVVAHRPALVERADRVFDMRSYAPVPAAAPVRAQRPAAAAIERHDKREATSCSSS